MGITDSPQAGFTPYKPSKGEAYMAEPQKEHFRQILRTWRDELSAEMDRARHRMQDETVNYPDPTDRATQESEMTLELRTRDRERKLIRKIEETLDQIDSGEYGFCESCAAEIGLRRLEARPTATLCIDCKSLAEIRERQMG
jgi:DnaK suppressor protein